MEEIKGMREAFKEAKIVFLTTFKNGEERTRPMTNYNEDPYSAIWFPTYRNTRKVEDISKNSKVLVAFPSSNEKEFYEITGHAEFEDEDIAAEKWRWWYLFWHPHQRRRFRFSSAEHSPDRVIINVHPKSARIVKE